ncbi:hypothetical protein AVEN_28701-1 [Araneus ventricosus]|uniref:Uncharacterized protein n=1 Tax=Araneus ventricosus TaxID=182803 RepID=A0A4Y2J3A2_ARAVE|nr:hypothetical protein AVEN_28701-1 [Araneus ventricosus]
MSPIPHSSKIPVTKTIEIFLMTLKTKVRLMTRTSTVFQIATSPNLFPAEIERFSRRFGLSKDSAELLGSSLKKKNLLAPGASFSWFRKR